MPYIGKQTYYADLKQNGVHVLKQHTSPENGLLKRQKQSNLQLLTKEKKSIKEDKIHS